MHVDAHVGRFRVHRRAAAALVADLIDDGVLDLERDARRVDGDGLIGPEMLGPANGAHAVVERAIVSGVDGGEVQQDAAGHARPQAGAIGDLERAREGDAGAGRRDVAGAERAQFVGDERLERFGASGEEVH